MYLESFLKDQNSLHRENSPHRENSSHREKGNSPHRVKCHKIMMIYPQPIRRHYHPKYTFITLAPVSYLRSLVVRAVHRHRTGVGSMNFSQLFLVRVSTCV